MQKLPFTWRLFRIFNFIHLAGVAALYIWVIYMFLNYGMSTSTEVMVFLLFTFCGAVLIINSIINHILLEHIYPDKYIEKRLSVTSIIVLILAILVLLTGTILYVNILFLALQPESQNSLWSKLFLSAFAIILLSGFYICVRQFFLKSAIRRNHQQSIENFLDTDN